MVDLMMMAIAVYDSVWLVQILPALLKNSNNSGKIALWSIVTIFPSLLSSFFYALTVRSRVLLGAVTNFDTDVLAEVIEDTESDRDLGVMVRTKILECLNQIEDDLSPQKRMEVLFNEIDVDNSKHLSTNEFFELINLMNVSFSKKKWRQIFRTIDKDGNDTISFHEMLLFLWPDDPLGLHKEQQRLRTVRKLASQTKELSLTRRSKKDVSYIVASASKAAIHPSSPSSGSVEIEDFDEKLETEVLYDH